MSHTAIARQVHPMVEQVELFLRLICTDERRNPKLGRKQPDMNSRDWYIKDNDFRLLVIKSAILVGNSQREF